MLDFCQKINHAPLPLVEEKGGIVVRLAIDPQLERAYCNLVDRLNVPRVCFDPCRG